jgi:hypothetical protein
MAYFTARADALAQRYSVDEATAVAEQCYLAVQAGLEDPPDQSEVPSEFMSMTDEQILTIIGNKLYSPCVNV